MEDDGAGISIERTRDLVAKHRLLSAEEAVSLSDEDVLNLLFGPGVSGAEAVTKLSGRGVGLDVVRTSVGRMSGTVDVSTQEGKGTRFTLKLPLTTTVIQTLMVGVGGFVFAIPSDIVLETLEVAPGDVRGVGRSKEVLMLRDRAIPFVRLADALNIPELKDKPGMIAVIIYRGDTFIALGVETVLDQMENIIKPFDPIAQGFTGFSGGTILGDGRVALLLDIPELLDFGERADERPIGRDDNGVPSSARRSADASISNAKGDQ